MSILYFWFFVEDSERRGPLPLSSFLQGVVLTRNMGRASKWRRSPSFEPCFPRTPPGLQPLRPQYVHTEIERRIHQSTETFHCLFFFLTFVISLLVWTGQKYQYIYFCCKTEVRETRLVSGHLISQVLFLSFVVQSTVQFHVRVVKSTDVWRGGTLLGRRLCCNNDRHWGFRKKKKRTSTLHDWSDDLNFLFFLQN